MQPFEIGDVRLTPFRHKDPSLAFMRAANESQGLRGLPSLACSSASFPERELPDLPFVLDDVSTGRLLGRLILYKPVTRDRSTTTRYVSMIPGVLIEGQRTEAWSRRVARLFRGLLDRELEADNGEIFKLVELRFPGFEQDDDHTHVWVLGNMPGFVEVTRREGLKLETAIRPDPEDEQSPTVVVRRLTVNA